jgi:hypothetical protein
MVTRNITQQKGRKGKKKLETLLKRDHKAYIGIILLTYRFQHANAIPGKVGLQLKHYRYALVKKDDMGKKYKEEMYKFFEKSRAPHKDGHSQDDLTAETYHTMREMKMIEKCISSRNNLSKTYLKNLRKAEILDKDANMRKTTYSSKKITYELKEKPETPLYSISPEKKEEIDVIIRKYVLKKSITRTIDDTNKDAFLTLEKQIREVLFSRKIPLVKSKVL